MNFRTMNRTLLGLSCAAMLQLIGTTLAADPTVNFSGKDPTEDELIEALSPPPKTRGISPGTVAGAVAPSVVATPKVSFDQITFELNSDRITPKARTMLDKLGRALSSDQLRDVDYLIEGHTDASGALQYNMQLSKRRAEAVKHYLVENFEIERSRLRTDGKGPTDLLDKGNPKSGLNRRVVFVPDESKP